MTWRTISAGPYCRGWAGPAARRSASDVLSALFHVGREERQNHLSVHHVMFSILLFTVYRYVMCRVPHCS
jgi:hypothetical protein